MENYLLSAYTNYITGIAFSVLTILILVWQRVFLSVPLSIFKERWFASILPIIILGENISKICILNSLDTAFTPSIITISLYTNLTTTLIFLYLAKIYTSKFVGFIKIVIGVHIVYFALLTAGLIADYFYQPGFVFTQLDLTPGARTYFTSYFNLMAGIIITTSTAALVLAGIISTKSDIPGHMKRAFFIFPTLNIGIIAALIDPVLTLVFIMIKAIYLVIFAYVDIFSSSKLISYFSKTVNQTRQSWGVDNLDNNSHFILEQFSSPISSSLKQALVLLSSASDKLASSKESDSKTEHITFAVKKSKADLQFLSNKLQPFTNSFSKNDTHIFNFFEAIKAAQTEAIKYTTRYSIAVKWSNAGTQSLIKSEPVKFMSIIQCLFHHSLAQAARTPEKWVKIDIRSEGNRSYVCFSNSALYSKPFATNDLFKPFYSEGGFASGLELALAKKLSRECGLELNAFTDEQAITIQLSFEHLSNKEEESVGEELYEFAPLEL